MRLGTKEYKKQNMQQADLAIKELINDGQIVTIQAIHELTGISKPTLYSYPNVLAHTRRNKKRKISRKHTSVPESTLKEKEKIDNSIDSYKNYIKNNYFFSSDTIENVRFDFLVNVEEFHTATFTQAINLLKLEGVLKSTVDPAKFVIEQPKGIRQTEPEVEFYLPGNEEIAAVEEQGKRVFEEAQATAHLMEYSIPLTNENTLYVSHKSNLTRDDAEDVIDNLELIIKRLKRQYLK